MKKTITLIVILIAVSNLFAGTWRVNNTDPTADFNSLDTAIATINAGDTLFLEGSTVAYFLTNNLTKKVTIIGPGFFLTENPNTLNTQLSALISGNFTILAEDVVIDGVVFKAGYGSEWVSLGADNITIRRCLVEKYLQFNNRDNSLSKDIYNCTVMQCYLTHGVSISNDDKAYNAIVINNIATSNNGSISGLRNSVIENNSMVSTYATITGNSGCTIKNNLGTQNDADITYYNSNCNINNNYKYTLSVDFIPSAGASTDGKWRLKESSAALTAGTNGSQCGVFGGEFPYVLSGLPSIPHIYEIDAPTSASAANGLRVTVRIGTEK